MGLYYKLDFVLMKRVIIADDHAVVATGLGLILENTPDIRIVAETRNGNELLQKIRKEDFDLVILDISMPGMDAFDVLKELKAIKPYLPVIIFTMNPEETYALRMFQLGAAAYIKKETPPDEIIGIIDIVFKKKKYLTPEQAYLLTQNLNNESQILHELLTDREFQVLALLASGVKKDEIAGKLNISKNTLSNHRNNLLKKLQLSNNAELTRYAIQHGFIQ